MSICYLWICSDGSVHNVLEVFSDMSPLINHQLIYEMIRWVDLATEFATRKTLSSCSMVL